MGRRADLDVLDIYLQSLGKPEYSPLPVAAERALLAQAQAGCIDSRNRVMYSVLPYAVYLANRRRGWGVDFEDLICEGNFGVVLAMRKFEPARGIKFITYATYWMLQRIRISLERAKRDITMRRPERLAYAGGRSLLELGYENKTSVETLGSGVPMIHGMILDMDDEIRGKIEPEDTREENPLDALLRKNTSEVMREQLVLTLNERERDVLLRRTTGEELASICQSYGITRERIRQIESAALAKLSARYSAIRLKCGIDQAPITGRLSLAFCEKVNAEVYLPAWNQADVFVSRDGTEWRYVRRDRAKDCQSVILESNGQRYSFDDSGTYLETGIFNHGWNIIRQYTPAAVIVGITLRH